MTVPFRVGEDPLEALMALKKQRPTPAADVDPLDELMASKSKGHDFHAEYASGALTKRMAGANARDAANLKDEEASTPSVPAQIGDRLAANLANVSQGIPGAERLQAGVRSVVRRQPYQESLKDIRGSVDEIPAVAKYGERMAGGLLTTPFLPANPALAGAVLGGADAALDADEMSGGRRAFNTVAGAGTGAVVGKVADKLGTALKAGFTKSPEANLLKRQADRAKSAKNLYDIALAQGKGATVPPEVTAYLAEPEIAARVGALQKLDEFKGLAPDSPEMLDALYKTLGDEAKQIGKGLAQADPSKPNTGRFRQRDVGGKKDRLLDALDPMMPTYRGAVEDFAKQSGEIAAVGRGMNAMQGNGRPSFRQIMSKDSKTPATFLEWAKNASPSEIAAAKEGILGDVKNAFGQPGWRLKEGRDASGKASKLLRDLDPSASENVLKLLGLVNASAANP